MKKLTILVIISIIIFTACKKKIDYTIPANLVGTSWTFTKTTETGSAYTTTYRGGFVSGTINFTSTTECSYDSHWGNGDITVDKETYEIKGNKIIFTILQYSPTAGKYIPTIHLDGKIHDDYIIRTTYYKNKKYYLNN